MRSEVFGDVHLHLGAHRTGSTAFQIMLSDNAASLGAQGMRVGFPSRGRVPNGQLQTYLEPQALSDPEQLEIQIAQNRADIAQIVGDGEGQQSLLSEENFIGGMISFQQGKFYPHARERMILLKKVLQPAEVGNVMLMIRAYDTLFVSAFRKRAENQLVPNYDVVRRRQAEFEGGWPKVVDDILSELKPRNLFVVPYRRERDDLALLGLLCPQVDTTKLQPSVGQVNASFPDAVLFEIQRRRRAGERLDWAEKRAIHKAYSGRATDQPFVKLLPKHAESLRARYLSDLELLRGRSDITLVED